MLDEGVESRSDGVHWIHWKRIDSDGKVHFLFVRDLEKFHPCWMRGWKSFRWSPSDPLETDRFRWKSSFSIGQFVKQGSLVALATGNSDVRESCGGELCVDTKTMVPC